MYCFPYNISQLVDSRSRAELVTCLRFDDGVSNNMTFSNAKVEHYNWQCGMFGRYTFDKSLGVEAV